MTNEFKARDRITTTLAPYLIANRLEFLRALELMVFDPEANKMVGERAHVHRILESELWVFGEQFNLMVSERGLTGALDRHLELLGETPGDSAPVTRLDGSVGRLDLLLSVAATEHDRNRHLVVELKAPKVVAGPKELAQIKSYAKAVAKDPRFASSTTEWDFWLVTGEIDDDVRQEANQVGRERGLVFQPDLPDAPGAKVRVWVRDGGRSSRSRRALLDDADARADSAQCRHRTPRSAGYPPPPRHPIAPIPNGSHPARTAINRLYTDPYGATRGNSNADTIPGDSQFRDNSPV